MNRKEYHRKLKDWEAEGYDVSELRDKWFPAKRAKGGSHIGTWLAIVTAVFIIVAGVVIWQVSQTPALIPAPKTVYETETIKRFFGRDKK